MSEWGAIEQARLLDHGWTGPEHFLLAVLAEPSVATETLNGLGVTYELVLERQREQRQDPDLPAPTGGARKGIEHNPAAYVLVGWARGFAAATEAGGPRPEHWLLALLYADHHGAMWLHQCGVSAQVVVDALAARGVRVPAAAPAGYRPWRGGRHVYVAEEELMPIVDLLGERHPPGSEWRWGFNWVGEPRRGRITAEEGIDLDAVVAEVRRQRG